MPFRCVPLCGVGIINDEIPAISQSTVYWCWTLLGSATVGTMIDFGFGDYPDANFTNVTYIRQDTIGQVKLKSNKVKFIANTNGQLKLGGAINFDHGSNGNSPVTLEPCTLFVLMKIQTSE